MAMNAFGDELFKLAGLCQVKRTDAALKLFYSAEFNIISLE